MHSGTNADTPMTALSTQRSVEALLPEPDFLFADWLFMLHCGQFGVEKNSSGRHHRDRPQSHGGHSNIRREKELL